VAANPSAVARAMVAAQAHAQSNAPLPVPVSTLAAIAGHPAAAGSGLAAMMGSYGDWTSGRAGASLPRDWQTFLSGAFGPNMPMRPMPIDIPREGEDRPEPRRWQYPVTWNLPHGVPGDEGLNLAPFSALRTISLTYSVARACIDLRVQEMLAIEWDIVPTKEAEKKMRGDVKARREFEARREPVRRFWRRPDSAYFNFEAWLGAVLEDVLSIDALSLYICPPKMRGKGVAGSSRIAELQLVDGSTVRPLLDMRGGPPAPPNPAFAQYMYGVPRVDLMSLLAGEDIREMAAEKWREYRGDQLLYLPYVTRSYNPYGLPPVERALVPIMSGLQRQQYQLDFFQEGSVPSVFISMGDPNATPNQCRELQDALNAMAGDPAWKHKIIVLPGGSKVDPMRPATLADMLDDLIMTQTTMAFGVMPMELGIMPKASNSGPTGGAQNQMAKASSDINERKALKPMLKWLKAIFDVITQDVIGATDMQWHWEGLEEGEDEAAAVEVLVQEITHGMVSIDEARVIRGHQPWGIPMTTEPVYFTATGVVPLGSIDMTTGAPIGKPPLPPGAIPGTAPPGGSPTPNGKPNGKPAGGAAPTPAHAAAQVAPAPVKPPKPAIAHQDPDAPRDRVAINKAAEHGHHVPGTGFEYTHGWVPTVAGLTAGLKEHHPDVEVHLTPGPTDKHVRLSLIRTPISLRSQGKADAAMRDLTAAADHHGLTLSLSPEPLAGDRSTSKTRLSAWYRRHGFTDNKGRDRDLSFSDTMRRAPKTHQVTGDEQDLADEIRNAGGNVHPDGTVDLYHHTSAAAAAAIRRTGRMVGNEDGVFFTTNPEQTSQAAGRGGAVVHLRVPLNRLVIDDVFSDEAHVKIPTRASQPVDVSEYMQVEKAAPVAVHAALRELDLIRRRINKGRGLDGWRPEHIPPDIFTTLVADATTEPLLALDAARTTLKALLPPDPLRARRDGAIADAQRAVTTGLRALANGVVDGSVSTLGFVDAATALMTSAIREGLRLGFEHAHAGAGPLGKADAPPVAGMGGRFGLYAGAVAQAYEVGRGLAVFGAADDPDNILIRWNAKPGACVLCAARDKSLFTVGTLPGWPGDGGFGKMVDGEVVGDATICLGGPNCRCALAYVRVTGEDIPAAELAAMLNRPRVPRQTPVPVRFAAPPAPTEVPVTPADAEHRADIASIATALRAPDPQAAVAKVLDEVAARRASRQRNWLMGLLKDLLAAIAAGAAAVARWLSGEQPPADENVTKAFDPTEPRDWHGRWTLLGAITHALNNLSDQDIAQHFGPVAHSARVGDYRITAHDTGKVLISLPEGDGTHSPLAQLSADEARTLADDLDRMATDSLHDDADPEDPNFADWESSDLLDDTSHPHISQHVPYAGYDLVHDVHLVVPGAASDGSDWHAEMSADEAWALERGLSNAADEAESAGERVQQERDDAAWEAEQAQREAEWARMHPEEIPQPHATAVETSGVSPNFDVTLLSDGSFSLDDGSVEAPLSRHRAAALADLLVEMHNDPVPAGEKPRNWYDGDLVGDDGSATSPVQLNRRGDGSMQISIDGPDGTAEYELDPGEAPAVADELRRLLATPVTKALVKGAADPADPNPVDAEHVLALMRQNFPEQALGWVRGARWVGPVQVAQDRIDVDDEDSWAAAHQPKRVKHFVRAIRSGDTPHPAVMVQEPDENDVKVIDGHHRALAYRKLGRGVPAYVGFVDANGGPWDQTHSYQYHSGTDPANKAAEHGHHVAGTPFEYYHDWVPRSPAPPAARPSQYYSRHKVRIPASELHRGDIVTRGGTDLRVEAVDVDHARNRVKLTLRSRDAKKSRVAEASSTALVTAHVTEGGYAPLTGEQASQMRAWRRDANKAGRILPPGTKTNRQAEIERYEAALAQAQERARQLGPAPEVGDPAREVWRQAYFGLPHAGGIDWDIQSNRRYLEYARTATRTWYDMPADRSIVSSIRPVDPKRPLAVYGNMLAIESNDQATHEHLADLAEMDPYLHAALAQWLAESPGGLFVGSKPTPDLDELAEYNMKNDPDRPWRTVGGAYFDQHRKIAIGYSRHEYGWTSGGYMRRKGGSTAGHEVGHAYDRLAGHGADASTSPQFRAIYARASHPAVAIGRTSPYFLQPGDRGPREYWAEAFRAWALGSPDTHARTLRMMAAFGLRSGPATRAGSSEFAGDVIAADLVSYFDATVQPIIDSARQRYGPRRPRKKVPG
jgi:Phage portal protein